MTLQISSKVRDGQKVENVAYIRQMLGELRQVAFAEGADLLCYLIEMAYIEAGDIQAGRRPCSVTQRQGHEPARVAI